MQSRSIDLDGIEWWSDESSIDDTSQVPPFELLYQVLFHPDCSPNITRHLHYKCRQSLRLVCRAARDAVDTAIVSVRQPRPPINSSKTPMPKPRLKALVSANWSNIHTLNIDQPFDTNVHVLARSNWPKLRKFTFNLVHSHRHSIGPPTADALLSANWPKLQDFSLNAGHSIQFKPSEMRTLTAGFLTVLFQKSRWPLKRLAVQCMELSEAGIAGIVSNTSWKLEDLTLRDNNITAAKLEFLLQQAPWLSCLKKLDLSGNPLGAAGGAVLASFSAAMPLLSALNLNICRLYDMGAQNLAQGTLPHLSVLSIKHNNLTGLGTCTITTSFGPTLTHLDLDFNDINLAGAAALARLCAPNLQKLSLRVCGLRPPMMEALARGRWGKLERLSINGNGELGDAGVEKFGQGDWRGLKKLDLYCIGMSSVGAALLARMPWPNLEELSWQKQTFTS